MRRPRSRLQVSTFPFLAVLLCAMGALLLLLFIMDRRAKIAAQNTVSEAVAERKKRTQAEEDARQEEWEKARQALHQSLLDQHGELANDASAIQSKLDGNAKKMAVIQSQHVNLEGKIQNEATRIAALQTQIAGRRTDLLNSDKLEGKAKAELIAAAKELAELERAFAQLKALRERDKQVYSVVPYRGKRGDLRTPIYVECTTAGVMFHPDEKRLEGFAFAPDAFRDEVERRAGPLAREKSLKEKSRTMAEERKGPYVLFLVRPSGIASYYKSQAALKGYEIDFGYELVDADWVLDFNHGDPNAKPAIAHKKPEPRKVEPLVPLPFPVANNGGASNDGKGNPSPLPSPSGRGAGGEGARPGPNFGNAGNGNPLPPPSVGSMGSGNPAGPGNGNVGGNPLLPNVGTPGSGNPPPPNFGSAGNGNPLVPPSVGSVGSSNPASPGNGNVGGNPLPPNVGTPDSGNPAPPNFGNAGGGNPLVPSLGGPNIGAGTPKGPAFVPIAKSTPVPIASGGNIEKPIANSGGELAPPTIPLPGNNVGPKGNGPAGNGSGGNDPAGNGPVGNGNGSGGNPHDAPPAYEKGPPPIGLDPGKKQAPPPAPPPSINRLLGTRDFIVTIDCYADHVTIFPSGVQYRWTAANALDTDRAFVKTVSSLIERRQASARPGDSPYRPVIRFQVARDGLRSYLRVYPLLEHLGVAMSRENVED